MNGRCNTCGEPSWIDECKVCFTLRVRPWQPMCGDRVVTPFGWTGRVVAQHGPYSWVSMEATNSVCAHHVAGRPNTRWRRS